MFRDEKKPEGLQNVNVLIQSGGLGDSLCALPAVNHLIATQTWINPLIWVPDYMVEFSKHVLPQNSIIRGFTAAKKKYNNKLTGLTTGWTANNTCMRTHPVDYAFQRLLDMHPYDNKIRSYLKVRPEEIDLSTFELPERYVAIVATAAETVKTMPIETMNSIAQYVKSKGYEVVFIGSEKLKDGATKPRVIKNPSIDFSAGKNLINKTNLLQLAGVFANASLVVTMDGGPMHVAGFCDTPIVAGFTFVSPDHLAPIRDGVPGKNFYPVIPDSSLSCRFCQTNWSLLYDHDFRDCFYKDFQCTKMMTFEKFKEQIDKVL